LIKVEHVEEHEDGGATYSLDMDDDDRKTMADTGLKFMLYCAVADISLQDAYDLILSIGEEELL
tara:strand:+ start:487 stop:678 length:192 start_codon:yes stop_codon:yes gene_type:complete